MAISDLLATIDAEARARAAQIDAAGEERAREIVQQAQTRRELLLEHQLEEERRTLEEQSRREVAHERREAAHQLALLRDQVINTVLEEAAGELAKLAPERLGEALVRLALEIRPYVEAEGVTLSVPATPTAAVEALRTALNVARSDASAWRVVATEKAAAGVIATTDDGRLRVDQSFAGRLRRMRPQLGIEILHRVAAEKP